MTLVAKRNPDKNTPRGERYELAKLASTNLMNIVNTWAEKSKGVSSEDLQLFWWQSQTIAKISKDPDKYSVNLTARGGTGGMRRNDGVDVLLDTLGIDAAAKRQYVNVAAHISEELYTQILEYNQQAGPTDTLLTKTHLLHLAMVSDPKVQKELVKLVINDGMSAVMLREEITRRLKTDNSLATSTVQQIRPTKIADQVCKAATNLLIKAEPLDSPDFLTRLSKVKPADVNKLLTNLDNAMEAVNQVKIALDGKYAQLEAAKTQLLEGKDKKPSENDLDIPEAVKSTDDADEPRVVKKKIVKVEAEAEEDEGAVTANEGGFVTPRRVVVKRKVAAASQRS